MTRSAPVRAVLCGPGGEPALPALLEDDTLQLQYHAVPEGAEFSALVQDIYQLHDPADRALAYPLLPGGCLTLLFPGQGQAMLAGPLTRLHRLTLVPSSSLYCARLRCGCGDWLTEESISLLTDRAVPLEPLLSGSDRLGPALSRCASRQEQTVLLSRLLTLHGGGSYQSTPLLRRSLALIEQRRGQLRIAELAQTAGCSERYLNRLFRQKVGFSAKTACELTQLHHSLHTILTTQPKSLLHIAVACGYFDQAHMNRHYRKFLTCTANDMRGADCRSLSHRAPELLP